MQLTSNNSEVTVPATVVLPAGQTSVSFNVTVNDSYIIGGTTMVALAARVENWTAGAATMTIYNTDTMALNGEWHMYGNGPAHTGYFPGLMSSTPLVTSLWSASLPYAAYQVAVAGGSVFASSGGPSRPAPLPR